MGWWSASRAGGCVASVVLAATIGSSAAGCSSDPQSSAPETSPTSAAPLPPGEAPLRVELVRTAVAAVEEARGGPQRFFEVNATPTVVNLFVATEVATKAVAYVYVARSLGAPAPPEPASGPTFASADIDFDETRVLSGVAAQLAGSDFRLFSITAVEAGGVQYRAVVDSAGGVEFAVFLARDGAVLGTDQDLGVGRS